MMNYPDTLLFIDGSWRPSASDRTIAVVNPATAQPIGTVAWADRSDLDAALEAARKPSLLVIARSSAAPKC